MFHKYFVSLTEVDFNETNNTFEISITLTGHDVEEWLCYDSIYCHPLEELRQHPYEYAQVQAAVLNDIQLSSGGKALQLHFFGSEVKSDDSFVIYLQSNPIEKPNSINIINNLLLKTFNQQQNKVIFLGDKTQSDTGVRLHQELKFEL